MAPLSGSGFPSRELSIKPGPDGFDTGWESRPTGGAAAGGVMEIAVEPLGGSDSHPASFPPAPVHFHPRETTMTVTSNAPILSSILSALLLQP